MTPIMTKHARERCEEMGVPVRVAKSIVANASLTYPGTPTSSGNPTLIARWDGEPEYAVVYIDEGDGVAKVLTVLFNCLTPYVRKGKTYEKIAS